MWFIESSAFQNWKESTSLIWINGKRKLHHLSAHLALALTNVLACSQLVRVKAFLRTSSSNSV